MTNKYQDKSQITGIELTPEDEAFLQQINEQIISFTQSAEEMLEFDPMNSYQRRLVHQIGTLYGLNSKSVGERDERYVCLLKTDNPEDVSAEVLAPIAPEAPREPSRKVLIERGDEIFYCRPGEPIVLRLDGSFGVPTEDNQQEVLDERVIESGMFRIHSNRLICPQDDEW